MQFEELLEEFRALGGVAENVRLGTGVRGRGVFSIDPSKPSTLFAPASLLVPSDDLELHEGHVRVKVDAPAGDRVRAFVQTYERHFGWGGGGLEAEWETQRRWHALAEPVKQYIVQILGGLSTPHRFDAPAQALCFRNFIEARHVLYAGRPHLMPVVDLVNHASFSPAYGVDAAGVAVRGTFDGEVLVSYGYRDTWSNALHYGFADRTIMAFSLCLDATAGTLGLSIRRENAATQDVGNLTFPKARMAGNTLELAYLMLGNALAMDVPRAQFRRLTAEHLSTERADGAFDGIARFNRNAFTGLLRLLQQHRGPVVELLTLASLAQLEGLADCVGARAL